TRSMPPCGWRAPWCAWVSHCRLAMWCSLARSAPWCRGMPASISRCRSRGWAAYAPCLARIEELMMSSEKILRIAQRLDEAARLARATPQLTGDDAIDLHEAYDVQRALV